MNPKFIEELFFNQIKDVTLSTAQDSMDYQFSDGWINKALSEQEYERSLCAIRGV